MQNRERMLIIRGFFNIDEFIMQNRGNFSHFLYCEIWGIFETCYIELPSYKNIVTHIFKVCKCLKYEKGKWNHLI